MTPSQPPPAPPEPLPVQPAQPTPTQPPNAQPVVGPAEAEPRDPALGPPAHTGFQMARIGAQVRYHDIKDKAIHESLTLGARLVILP